MDPNDTEFRELKLQVSALDKWQKKTMALYASHDDRIERLEARPIAKAEEELTGITKFIHDEIYSVTMFFTVILLILSLIFHLIPGWIVAIPFTIKGILYLIVLIMAGWEYLVEKLRELI